MKRSGSRADPFWKDTPLVDEREIFTELADKKGSSLFLGRYSLGEVVAVLNKRGFLKEARKRFLWPLAYDLDSSEYPLQRLRIYLREPGTDNLIVDVKLKECEFAPAEPVPGLRGLPPQKALSFEWLTLQNPLVKFGEPFTPLPGQTRPGLRMSARVMDQFVYLARLTRKDCLVAFPAYFHNAVLFSRYFRFWNPRKEAEVLAIRRAFRHVPFRQLAWAVHLNCLRRADGSVYEWSAEEQVNPLTRPLRDRFDSREYRQLVRAGERGAVFAFDKAEYEKRAQAIPTFCDGPTNLL
jgi:hypothetical protein